MAQILQPRVDGHNCTWPSTQSRILSCQTASWTNNLWQASVYFQIDLQINNIFNEMYALSRQRAIIWDLKGLISLWRIEIGWKHPQSNRWNEYFPTIWACYIANLSSGSMFLLKFTTFTQKNRPRAQLSDFCFENANM